MRAIITSSYYRKEPFTVHWIGRWEDGRKMHYAFMPPFKPYFYHEDDNGNIVKQEVDLPSDVPVEREKYTRTWEADIVFPERVLIDMGIRKGVEIHNPDSMQTEGNVFPADYTGIPIKKIYIDIETDDTQKIDLNEPKGAVLSIAMRDSSTNLTTIYTTIPEEKINTKNLMNLLRSSNMEIRYSLNQRGLEHLCRYVGNMDIKVVSFKTEKDMLKAYHDYLYSDNYGDVNIGYNIKGFDLPYLQNRAIEPMFATYEQRGKKTKKRDLNLGYVVHTYGRDTAVSHNRVINFDLYEAYLRLHENDLESASLESVSNLELGIGKVKHKEGYREMYEKEPEKFLVYNYRDALLCQLIDMKIGAFDFFLMLSNKAGTLDTGKWNSTYLIDTLLFRVTHGTDFHMPTHTDQKKIEVPGGKVIPASKGLFRNVVVFDFKHMYPRFIRQFNMSYETLLLGDQIGDDDIKMNIVVLRDDPAGGKEKIPEIKTIGFSSKKEGVMPSTLLQLETERYAIKKKMRDYPPDSDMYQILNNEQRSIKEIDNSFYGMTGSEHARLFSPYIQAAITYLGREAIIYVKEVVEKEGYDVIYGDTDSIFIHSKKWDTENMEEIIKDAERLNGMVNSTLINFVRRYRKDGDCIMEMEFEKLYSVWAQFGHMKQYAGNVIYKDGVILREPMTDIKGFDSRRSVGSAYTKNYLIPTLLKKVLDDVNEARKFIENERNKWSDMLVDPEDIGIYFSLQKEQYANDYQQKRAVDTSMKMGIKLDRMKGKFRMYFLRGKPDVVALNYDDAVPREIRKKLDWEAHRRRCFDLRIEDIEKVIGKKGDMDIFEEEE